MPAITEDFIDAVLESPKRNALYERAIGIVYQAQVLVGDIVLDGGAAIGVHTIPLSACVGSTGRVLAFEPLVHVALLLRAKLQKSGAENVEVQIAALSSRAGKAEFHYIKKNSTTADSGEAVILLPQTSKRSLCNAPRSTRFSLQHLHGDSPN